MRNLYQSKAFFVSTLDNYKNKQGERRYGTNLLVESPKVLTDSIKLVVISKAGVYNDEIKAEILQSINDSAVVIEWHSSQRRQTQKHLISFELSSIGTWYIVM